MLADAVQDKINELSHRGSGQAREKEIAKVSSKFDGRFALASGTLRRAFSLGLSPASQR